MTIRGFSLQFGTDNKPADEDVDPPRTILDEPGEPDTFKRDSLAKMNELNSRLVWIFGALVALIVIAFWRH